MMDRLVCADGGNPDPTTTAGQGPEQRQATRARRLVVPAAPRRPRVLGGRAWRLRRRGDGAQSHLRLAARHRPDRGRARVTACSLLVGYMQPYATSHDDLDRDTAFQEEVRNAARALMCSRLSSGAVGNCSSRTRTWTRPVRNEARSYRLRKRASGMGAQGGGHPGRGRTCRQDADRQASVPTLLVRARPCRGATVSARG